MTRCWNVDDFEKALTKIYWDADKARPVLDQYIKQGSPDSPQQALEARRDNRVMLLSKKATTRQSFFCAMIRQSKRVNS